jgi:xylulokinase
VFADYTYLWATGLSDTQNYTWSDDVCRAIGISVDKLPRIVKSSEIIGSLGPEAAAATGLITGILIVAGATDEAAGFVGAGITKPTRWVDSNGTFPVIGLCTDQFRPDMTNRMAEILPSIIPGLRNPISMIIGGG